MVHKKFLNQGLWIATFICASVFLLPGPLRAKVPPDVYTSHKTLKKRLRSISGTIEGSLWQSLRQRGADPELIRQFCRLLDSRVNFRKLKPQDRFQVYYEQYYDVNRPVRVGNIITAKLTSGSEQVSAFRFNHHGRSGYYDKNGNNLQKAYLSAPLQEYTISSGYTNRRNHPILNTYQSHYAIDYAAPAGRPVMSIGDGVVTAVDSSPKAGKHIQIRHNSTFKSRYSHLKSFADGVSVGWNVNKGQIVGYVGSTGRTTGPHLEFKFIKNGRPVDYRKVKLPDGRPLAETCREKFYLVIQQINEELEETNEGKASA